MAFFQRGADHRAACGSANGHCARPPRFAAAVCFLLGLTLMLLAAAGAVYGTAASESRFEAALLRTVSPAALGTDEASLRGFARDTMAYLNHQTGAWSPTLRLNGIPAERFIPAAFTAHMVTVKNGFQAAKAALIAGAALALGLLLRALWSLRQGGRFSVGGYYLGTALPLAALAGIGGWALADFDSLWGWLHRTFIPDGIFNADEPVMRLFPLELFADYLPPAALGFGIAAAAALALPLLLKPLGERMEK